ncbi:MAG: thioredoxin domain-containing protein [Firmicutes bacterium]|nr:thioredoxin domain-containing protein [Bacillota bacterium]
MAPKPNRLIEEKSPYLLQHAHNPVDWYPWGEEAFAKAKKEKKPIFLSIGYSTCHWCHVMERESFDSEEVGMILNEKFVAIKVDREERPDIDAIYMTACQALTGQGGWPLTIIMTPDKKPFFAGTYFPKESSRGMPGLIDILRRVTALWEQDRQHLRQIGHRISTAMNNDIFRHDRGEVTEKALTNAFSYLASNFDSRWGGFSSAPKFPTPHNLSFLLRYWSTSADNTALKMVTTTLEAMYCGGIWDHIGFGFARYSTDDKWLVPHFEKMLYDNALLAICYLEAYQVTGKALYAKIARQIFTYVIRDMSNPEGGFYTAEDADSEGEEGKFYLWTPAEIKSVLGKKAGDQFCRDYDISKQGNFNGRSIPNLISRGPIAGHDEALQKLFVQREQRVRPFKDDKILTALNGLMIAALAYGSRVLGNKGYMTAAQKAVAFIESKLRRADGRLLARYRDNEAAHLAYLDDYAFLIWGLIELHQSTLRENYLQLALKLTDDMLELFWDPKEGGLFLYGRDAEELISRPKEIYDGATPAGNSVAAVNLIRLARLTKDRRLEQRGKEQLAAFGGSIEDSSAGHTHFLMAVWLDRMPPFDITVTGEPAAHDTQSMLAVINSKFLPAAGIVFKPNSNSDQAAAVQVCRDFVCHQPVYGANQLKHLLQ